MTYESPDWDPSSSSFAQREENMMDYKGEIVDRTPAARGQRVIDDVSTSCAAEPTINFHFSQGYNLKND